MEIYVACFLTIRFVDVPEFQQQGIVRYLVFQCAP